MPDLPPAPRATNLIFEPVRIPDPIGKPDIIPGTMGPDIPLAIDIGPMGTPGIAIGGGITVGTW